MNVHRHTAPPLLLACAVLSLATRPASAAAPTDSAPPPPSAQPQVAPSIDDYNVIWNSPSKNSLESIPMGNGDIGLNIWVEPSGDLVFFIGKTDAWDENLRLLKLGKVRVKFTPALETGSGFRQELKLRDGVLEIRTPQAKLRVWVDANHPVIQVDATSLTGEPLEARAAFELWRREKQPLDGKALSSTGFTSLPAISHPDTILPAKAGQIGWYHRNVVSPWPASLQLQKVEAIAKTEQDPLLNRTCGAILRGDNWTSASDTEIKTVKPAKDISLAISALTQITDTPEAWVAAIEAQAAEAGKIPAQERLAAHRQWWQAFWDRSWILAGGSTQAEGVTRAYTLQRWVHACGGRGAFPIKFNGSIFTVDNTQYGADYRAWGGGYWFQNTRLPYWSMLEAGDYDLMMPLFKMYMKALPARKLATRNYYGHEGAFFPETMSFWGNYLDHGSMGYGLDRKNMADGTTQNGDIRIYWQGGIELSAMMIRRYEHTRDADFLKNTVLPFVHEIITFYDQHYKRDANGKILFSPAYALEDIWGCANPMPEIVGLRANLAAMIALTDDDAKRRQYQRMLGEMPEVPAAKDKDGVERLAACAPLRWAKRKRNSEKPELYGVFPHLAYGMGRPGLDLAREAWKHSIKDYHGIKPAGWSQDPVFMACLGMTDEAKAQLAWRSGMTQNGSRFPAFWTQNFDWMPDQDHGSVNMIGLQKMLMQPNLTVQGDEIFMLPAWPRDWTCSFKLHAPKQTTVEGEVKDGRLVNLKVTPESRRKDIRVRQGDGFIPLPQPD